MRSILTIFFYLVYSGAFAQQQIDILVPRPHQPIFAQPGDMITLEILDSTTKDFADWKVLLKNDLAKWDAKIISAKPARIFNETKRGLKLELKIPENITMELMDAVIVTKNGRGISERSVSVLPKLEEDFYIFHQSDQHILGDSAVEPGGKASKTHGHGSKQALTWLTSTYNLTNPRFVLNTGDNMHLYNVAKDWCGIDEAKNRVQRFFDGVSGYKVPTIIATGNHDMGWNDYVQVREWRDVYNSLVGQRAFSLRMGSFYMLVSEWTTRDYYDWAKDDFTKSFSDPTIKFRLHATHFFEGFDKWTTIETPEKFSDLVLVGHNHRTRILRSDPFYVLSVASAQDYQKAAFYNFKRANDGWETDGPRTHSDSTNVFRLIGDYGKPKVFESFSKPNNGKERTNSVSVTNELPLDFYNGRIRFLMKKRKKLYKVQGGEILTQYRTADKKMTAVLVKVNIRNKSVTNISISK